MLGENPEIVKRLRNEIIATIGLERPPTYEDLRSLKYLRAFVNGMHCSSKGLLYFLTIFWSIRNSSFVPVCVSHFPSLYAGFFELPDVCFCRPMNGRTTTEPTILPSENGSPPMFIPAGSRYETSWLRRYSLA